MPNRLACLLLATAALALAQQTGKPPHTVRAFGDATLTTKPDRAEITLGVFTSAATADASSAQNAKTSTQILQSLKQALGTHGDIKTSNYAITPEYQYAQNGVPPKLTGYRTSNSVEVTVDDLSLVGKLLDLAVQSGANEVSGITFSLKDDSEIRGRALAEAAVKARANAESIAKALNLHVTGVIDAESSSDAPPVRPVMMQMLKSANSGASTPVEEGTLNVHAKVIIVLGVE